MRNRGALLALLVLGIATVLMIFFVMPRISGDRETAERTPPVATPQTPAPAAAPAAPVPPQTPDPAALASAASAKLSRLTQSAEKAVDNLSNLFADGRIPAADAYGDARAVAQTALEALAGIDNPAGLDSTLAGAIATAQAHAGRALSLVKALPLDPAVAGPSVRAVAAALRGEEAPASGAVTPAAPAENAAAAEDADAPKFDVLRVERDGSAVIAGSAKPGAKIEIVDGETVIASAEAGASGDFATVLDIPLKPGDHSISLRATDQSGKPKVSAETATVSVPHDNTAELLAMITKPGAPSRVITMPEAEGGAAKGDRPDAASTEKPAADATAPIQTPAPPAASAMLSQTAPTIAPDTVAPANMPAKEPAAAGAQAEIAVTAVEIEGDRIFIAGTAAPGSTIRAYADDMFVGEAETDKASHFVVEGRIALDVGDHTIRVDMVDATGKVTVRASVPFNRPAGDQIAVIAADQNGAGGTLVTLDQGAFRKQLDAVARAFDLLRGLYADGKAPTLDALAAARSGTEIALKSLGEFRPAAETPTAVVRRAAQTTELSMRALKTLQALPQNIEAVGKALPQLAELIGDILKRGALLAPAPTAEPTPVSVSAAAGFGTNSFSAQMQAEAQPKTIEQAPLQQSDNSVIIRRGDTLWQISRRVYGQGVRYTTIYLANETQIRNPDLIEPGQIFNVPNEALPNAEELHRRRLRGQKLD